jgi:predicted RNA-binding protein YlqC (UPF0109 family)
MCDSKTAQVYEMLLSVVRSLVDHPEEIKVSVITEETSTLFQVRSCSRDIGKLIGSKGRTAKALRIILAANAMKLKRSFRLDIDSPESTVFAEHHAAHRCTGSPAEATPPSFDPVQI